MDHEFNYYEDELRNMSYHQMRIANLFNGDPRQFEKNLARMNPETVDIGSVSGEFKLSLPLRTTGMKKSTMETVREACRSIFKAEQDKELWRKRTESKSALKSKAEVTANSSLNI